MLVVTYARLVILLEFLEGLDTVISPTDPVYPVLKSAIALVKAAMAAVLDAAWRTFDINNRDFIAMTRGLKATKIAPYTGEAG